MRLHAFAFALLVACHPRATSTTSATSSAIPSAAPSATTATTIALAPPGVVIDHVAAPTGIYIGSPSIAILADGSYVASHDFFGPGTNKDATVVFGSTDRGAHWSKLADIEGQWWSTLFVHDGRLHLIGTSRQFGHVVIRRSSDGGRTWTTPADAMTGLLTPAAGYHCAPTPVVAFHGRIWRAFERRDSTFKALVASAPVNADLLAAASWTFTNEIASDRAWLGGDFENWLEGNVVVDRGGALVDILRVNSKANTEHAAIVRIASDTSATFDAAKGFIDFPGGSKKFTIRFDPQSNLHWSLANTIPRDHTGGHTDSIRNTLALVSSPDLVTWTERAVVLHSDDRATHGFHYVDWLFDGDDIIAVSRTAFDDDVTGAHSAHDANYLTFHRVAHFRDAATVSPLADGSKYENADFIITGAFTLDTLADGKRAFTNRKYVWTTTPPAFAGWSYTRLAGGESPTLHVHAKRKATLFVATKTNALGWQLEGSTLGYDDPHHTRLLVLKHEVAAGEDLSLSPTATTWSGAIVLVR